MKTLRLLSLLALGSAAAFAAGDPAGVGAPRVTYVPATEVDRAFARGAVLFDSGANYMIHASRRERPGEGEVHLRDTDVIHVLDGQATFVTGGQLVAGHEVGPGEIRGSAIAGGDSRVLAKGDVIVVPNGVPHWFRDVSGPFLYFVVKVR